MEKLGKTKRIGIIVLIVLNLVVLLGQIWPDGAPPFARIVNIIFLTLALIVFISMLFRRKLK